MNSTTLNTIFNLKLTKKSLTNLPFWGARITLNSKSQNIRTKFSHKSIILSFVTLLFILLLSSSLFYTFNSVSPFVSGAEPVYVNNFVDLQEAVNSAVGSTVIGLTADISLPSGASLIIPSGTDVVLVSVGASVGGFWKLIGADGKDTITVENGGKLTLGISEFNGIIVTHGVYDDTIAVVYGRGVKVSNGGDFVFNSGEISGNIVNSYGGGVSVDFGNSFMMNDDARVVNNTAYSGGGVSVACSSFIMSGSSCVADNPDLRKF